MLVEGEERCLAKSKGRPHVPVSKRTLTLLRRFYRSHNFKYVPIEMRPTNDHSQSEGGTQLITANQNEAHN